MQNIITNYVYVMQDFPITFSDWPAGPVGHGTCVLEQSTSNHLLIPWDRP